MGSDGQVVNKLGTRNDAMVDWDVWIKGDQVERNSQIYFPFNNVTDGEENRGGDTPPAR